MKNSISKNGAVKPRRRQVLPHSQWLSHLDAYKQVVRLVFERDDELEKAIDLLWTNELRNLPHDTPDGQSLVVPAEAVSHFRDAGIKFSVKNLKSIRDLHPDQIAELRK